MKLQSRCFPGQSFRPSPAILQSENIVSVVTPWNASLQEAEKMGGMFEENYTGLSADPDSTRPFQILFSLSDEENNLRTACVTLNQMIFQKNKDSLSIGFEAFFGVYTASQLIFAQIGHPQIFLSRPPLPLQPLGHSLSLSTSYSQSKASMPPLPHTLLGVFSDTPIHIHSIKIFPQDKMILVSRNFIPAAFLQHSDISLNSLSSVLAQDNSSEPFWLACLDF